jgi:ribosome-binding factor A
VVEYHTSNSVVTVQCAFHAKYAKVFVPPLQCDLADLKAKIIAAVKNIDASMLTCVVART